MASDEKLHHNEREFFLRRDAEWIKQRRAELDAERVNGDRLSHYMKCPKCGADLHEQEYHQVKVDICSACGGMWLDKGEIEMLTHHDRSTVSRFVGSLFNLK